MFDFLFLAKFRQTKKPKQVLSIGSRKSADYPLRDLPKSGYKPNMKYLQIFQHPSIL